MEAVRAEDLSKRFGSFWAVRGVTFTVQEGEIFGFLGPNGAGKSTTIRMLCGILAPSGGRGLVAGYDVGREPEKVKSALGYMSQKFSLYDDLTVEENIEFYSGIYRLSPKKQAERKTWVLAMAGLAGREKSLPRELSGGWKQRLALGCAILHEPRILFLDEPTAGVDPVSRRRFWDLIATLSEQGTTVFVTTHYMDEAEHCHRLALINQGELVALGSPRELKHSLSPEATLEDVFVSLTREPEIPNPQSKI
jgi:ABC-2 type transport system ATP-binding protein